MTGAILAIVGVDRFHKFLGFFQPLQLLRQLGDSLRVIGGNGSIILRRLRPALIVVGFIRRHNGLAHFVASPLAVTGICRAHDRLAQGNCVDHVPGLLGQRITLGAGLVRSGPEAVNAVLLFLLVIVQKIILSDFPASKSEMRLTVRRISDMT